MRRLALLAAAGLLAGATCTPRARSDAADRPAPGASFAALRDGARAALRKAEARLPALDAVAREVSFPSIAMLIDEADGLKGNANLPRRDELFVLRQLEDARAKAETLAAGTDPYRAATGVLMKAYRSELDGTLQPYALAVPRAYDGKTPWPLLVALHGAGSDHRQNLARAFGVRGSDDDAVFQDAAFANAPMLVVSPLGRGEVMGYHGLGEDDVLRVLADVRRAYNVDPDRIFLTGLSMGGGGTWHLGLRRPDLFAALVPVCGVVDPRKWIERRDRELYDDAALELQLPIGLAENALNQRVFVYHGDADTVVPVDDSRRLVKRFQALGWLGKTVRYVELPGVAHNAWDTAYRDGNVFTLLAGISRDPFPARVVFKTSSLRYQQAYWLRVDRIERGGALAQLTGERGDKQTFTVRAENVAGFSLLLEPRFVSPASAVTVHVATGGSSAAAGAAAGAPIYQGPAQPVLSFAADKTGWRAVKQPAVGAPPDHAVVGLMSRSLPRQRPHLYVYGTAGAAEVNAETQALARALAEWGPGVRARFPVKADRDVTPDELASRDLVLVGNGRVNLLARRLSAQLPIGDDAATGERAYRLVVPNPLAPSRFVLLYAAESVRALRRLHRFVAPNGDAWAPESNLDYVLFEETGRIRKSGVFRDEHRLSQ